MEIEHFSHPAHKLTHEKVVEGAKKGAVCAVCEDEISSEYYCCGECNFFLHKLCAEIPSDFTHSMHPLHPLRLLPHNDLYDSGSTLRCDNCYQQIVEGLIYHCGICSFDLHLKCAFPNLKLDLSSFLVGSKLSHIFHPHILTCEKLGKNVVSGVVCAACLGEISGRTTELYRCRPCNFFLHKLCAERPTKMTHSLHPLHPLQLLSNHPYPSGNPQCDACNIILEGFVYNCAICNFDIDFICAFPDGGKLNHICHLAHVLTFEKVVKRLDSVVVCAACVEEISGPLADYYSCRKCNFFLHKLCAQRPPELASSLHPQHQLRLIPKDSYTDGTAICRGCEKSVKGFVYGCTVCPYNFLEYKCVFPKSEKRIQTFEQLHHHPLIFQARPAKFRCDVCSSPGGDEGEEDQSYSCSTCDFWIHKRCAFATLAQHYKGHPHPLSLVQGIPEDLQVYGHFYCDVCHNIVPAEELVFHCERCRYFIHVRCMITDDDTDLTSSIKDVDYLDDSFFKHLLKDDEFVVAYMPSKDLASEVIQPFLVEKNGIVMDLQPKIRHHEHEHHDMILFLEPSVNNDRFFEEEDEEILSDGCINPITAPYYCCQECNYYLHLACANLPSQIEHFSHPHELELGNPPRNFQNLQLSSL